MITNSFIRNNYNLPKIFTFEMFTNNYIRTFINTFIKINYKYFNSLITNIYK